ncbi:hypothetical protein ACEOBI_25615 [Escherichia coli]|nr:hypothetical protein [Escherichia coli]
MKPDIYYGTVLKTCRDFDIILVNNFIDRVFEVDDDATPEEIHDGA